jgi:hypothetical protein
LPRKPAPADQASRPSGGLKLFYAPARYCGYFIPRAGNTRETGILGREQVI